jgi:hypothetical protein
MKNHEDIEFLFKKIPSFSNVVLDSYKNLPLDNYLQSQQKFRKRRFSEIVLNGGEVLVEQTQNFFQQTSINHYAGGLSRSFEPIEPKPLEEFISLYQRYISPIFYNKNTAIGLHQIRITCSDDYVGHPVPEGWHVDGFDYVAIACISGSNFLGGTSRIKSNLDYDHDTFSRILLPSEVLVFNDKKYYHHTDPINNATEGIIGYRDILVITIQLN